MLTSQYSKEPVASNGAAAVADFLVHISCRLDANVLSQFVTLQVTLVCACIPFPSPDYTVKILIKPAV